MKVMLRKMVRKEIGNIVREEAVEASGVLTVTGLVASPLEDESKQAIEANLGIVAEADSANVPSADTNVAVERETTGKVAFANSVTREETGAVTATDMNGSGTNTVKRAAPTAVASTKPETKRETETTTVADTEVKVQEMVKTREEIVQDIRLRVRYLLTLKGRPPFRLAGLEMYRGLQELVVVLDKMLAHHPDASLTTVHQTLFQALAHFFTDF